MTQASILYFECIDDPMDSHYAIDQLQGLPAEVLSIDAYSSAEVLQLVTQGIRQSTRLMLLIDSTHGSRTDGLIPLINAAMSGSTTVWWIGNHPLAAKVLAMTKGHQYDALEKSRIDGWINQG